jgi:thioredoxin-related protein
MRRVEKIIVQTILFVCVFRGFGQVNINQQKPGDTVKGIAFENQLNWQQVLQKAKTEDKYIFVDCYASWCGPCKWMDKNVYINDTVADFMNKAFISVKLQMDSNKKDDAATRDWYGTAHEFAAEYGIKAYPTYLFFSPNGSAVHKGIGVLRKEGFVTIAKASMDSRQQYYTLLNQYQKKYEEYALMPYLANNAAMLGEDSLASAIAHEYIHHLEEMPDQQLWTKENIEFIQQHGKIIHFEDKIFQRFLKDKIKIDSIMGSTEVVDDLINLVAYDEEIRPRIDTAVKKGLEPDWNYMEKSISKKYGRLCARENIIEGRVDYYNTSKRWDRYVKYLILEMQSEGIQKQAPGKMTSYELNGFAMEIFTYSSKKKELKLALSLIEKALLMNAFQADELDTKANLLYKLGRKAEALTFEQKSVNLAPQNKSILENYAKMKAGQPTW